MNGLPLAVPVAGVPKENVVGAPAGLPKVKGVDPAAGAAAAVPFVDELLSGCFPNANTGVEGAALNGFAASAGLILGPLTPGLGAPKVNPLVAEGAPVGVTENALLLGTPKENPPGGVADAGALVLPGVDVCPKAEVDVVMAEEAPFCPKALVGVPAPNPKALRPPVAVVV